DRDPLRLAMAAANARAAGLAGRVTPVAADLEREPPPAADAIFFDPARRSAGRRVFALAGYQPPVALLAQWQQHTPAIGMKAAPGVSDDDLNSLVQQLGGTPFESEFISVGGKLKEAAIWLGPLGQPGRRATLLVPGAPIHTLFRAHGAVPPAPPLAEPQGYLYEPDPAVIRAHLVAGLAMQLGAAQLDREIAYLTGAQPLPAPFARCWHI
ncbi:hypothetical protein SE17_42140, partial [Kouleothrix aurantiaca]